MAKKLIVLSDGTGNSAAKLFKTNVWKLYEALDLTPSSNQIALYDDGVGTSRFKPWALLTGAFGFGLKRNVLKMYVFLSRHYHNEVEAQKQSQPPPPREIKPEIYGFGFSRGAFTIRVLTGLVIRQGLVPLGSESEMSRMALLSYREYRKQCFHTKFRIEKPFRDLRDAVVSMIDRLRKRPPYTPDRNTKNVRIRFLGLWDTVAAYGMPIEELRLAIDRLIFPLTFASSDLLPQVDCARHALSIDDERSSFAPMLWDHEEGNRLKQVWFAGMHANVGGGYPDDSLSSAPLAWMAFNAKDEGLQFHQHALDEIRGRATPFGKMYDSRSGLSSFYRYQPRQVRCQIAGVTVQVPPVVHESVVFRMATGFQWYAPIAFPQEVKVVDKKGKLYQFVGFKTAAARRSDRFEMLAMTREADEDHKLAEMVALLKPPAPQEVKLVAASVLRRRIAYFGTLVPALVLAAFPVLGPTLPQLEQIDRDWVETLGELGKLVASITPWYLLPWQTAVAHNPIVAAALAAIAFVFYWRGKALRARIADRARAAWNIGNNKMQVPSRPSLLDGLALRLLGSLRAKATWEFTAGKAFPACAILLAVLAPAVLLDRTVLWLQSSSGKICRSETAYKDLITLTGAWQKIELRADDACLATKFRVRKDHRYEIQFNLDPKGSWKDGGIHADLAGLDFANVGWLQQLIMYAGIPARRHMGQPWFVPIVRVGKYGSEEYVLGPANVRSGSKPRWEMTGVIAPTKNDELFLFVNDAYSGLIPLAWMEAGARQSTGGWTRHLYGNNSGTTTVSIRREPAQSD